MLFLKKIFLSLAILVIACNTALAQAQSIVIDTDDRQLVRDTVAIMMLDSG